MSESNPFDPPPRTWRDKFADAFSGVWLGVEGQNSFVVHLGCLAIVLAAAGVSCAAPWHWVALLSVSALVICSELFNSAMEAMARAVTDEYHSEIDRALKVASGSVLVAAGFAVVVGVVVFCSIWFA